MLLHNLQHTLSQLLALAPTDAPITPMAVAKDGRIVPIPAAGAARLVSGKVRRNQGHGSKAYGIVVNWFGTCAAVMAETFGPAGDSQPSRSAKT